MPPAHPKEVREAALAAYRDHGLAEAVRRSGVPQRTIQDWAKAGGVRSLAVEKGQARVTVAKLSISERCLRLADGLLDDLVRLRDELFAPCVERKAMVADKDVQIVDIHRSQPTFGDQQRIMTTIAIGVDKVQLLTGGATERIEEVGPDERRRALGRRLDDLAARRAARLAG